ncbi:MAG: aminotransferase class I/II-fold pyridoxal phosphate-dependent enzyme [Firmicutes bacterium]|nr:aminotransferase class I/II-fold pyridoxal phosphate-dependent enzyme [Bacillota bacterium]
MSLIHGGDWAGFVSEYGKLPLDFSSNISPLGLSPRVKQAVIDSLERADRYPDPLCRRLTAALSERHGVPADRIVCGNGAADIIFRLAYGLRPATALVTAPTFAEYALALTAAGTKVDSFPLRREEGFRVNEELLTRITPGLDLLILCEPNNPTGRTTERSLLGRISRRCRETGILLMIDECFLPFVADEAAHSLVGELAENSGLLILRAFTKWYAMAGLRLGYAFCGSEELARKIRNCGQPWPVSVPAEEAGLAALADREQDAQLRAVITGGRRQLSEGLTALGLEVIPGEANFLLFRSTDTELCRKLREKGILLRDCANFAGLSPGWYRTAIRTEEDNNALLTALREVIQGD